MKRSALVGSLKLTIQAECSSSRASVVSSLSSFSAAWTAFKFSSELKSAFRIDGQVHARQHFHYAGVAEAAFQAAPDDLQVIELHQEIAELGGFEDGLVGELSTLTFSVARRRISRVNSLSSLMYFSLLPFLMRYSGGCATNTWPRLMSFLHVAEEERKQQGAGCASRRRPRRS